MRTAPLRAGQAAQSRRLTITICRPVPLFRLWTCVADPRYRPPHDPRRHFLNSGGRRPRLRSDIVIVGASLGGLMTGLALSRHGLGITLLERSTDVDRTGAALQVGHGLLEQLTGRRHAPGSLATGVQTWQAVHAGLQSAIGGAPDIAIIRNARVAQVGQDGGGAWAITADGRRFDAAVVIGADGYQSVVRRHVTPERPDAVYADYLAWVGFADERTVADFPRDLAFLQAGDYYLLGFPLPARDGSATRGRRRIGWAWYDAGHNAILRDTGAIEGRLVRHSLRPGDMPETLLDELAALARRHWPSPWREAILDCIAQRAILGTPVVEYLPERLVKGRLGLMGDAAHVATPMTGNGFSTAAGDALILARFLDGAALAQDAEAALRSYETVRLDAVRAVVLSGQRFSRDFVRG
jgi:2-polyprenyl-6-methoxyphenol hydroxylase-like FAD-dependent oxidoreductase